MLQELPKIQDFYKRQLLKHGPENPMALHWISKETQEIRFIALSLVGELEGRSVLDLGCGVGDLYGYFKKEDIRTHYTGWDISEEMITAAKNKYPEAKFEVKNIQIMQELPQFDYVLASGTMNVKINGHDAWVKMMIRSMFSAAKRGVGFNLLSISSPEKDDVFYYADPVQILSFCRTLTPYVSLRHDYLPGDFTVYMQKKI